MNTLAVWNEVYEKFPDIKNASTTYQTAARKGKLEKRLICLQCRK